MHCYFSSPLKLAFVKVGVYVSMTGTINNGNGKWRASIAKYPPLEGESSVPKCRSGDCRMRLHFRTFPQSTK
jgi:hypothetical protein